ncbi:hypothetical protein M405DRAFT_554639 [Rhizopogon salebrosus TDB-379]|nr:hypothetical protein M405DRAFT_554639 [Rhizopogon salebrosus TDB-379]
MFGSNNMGNSHSATQASNSYCHPNTRRKLSTFHKTLSNYAQCDMYPALQPVAAQRHIFVAFSYVHDILLCFRRGSVRSIDYIRVRNCGHSWGIKEVLLVTIPQSFFTPRLSPAQLPSFSMQFTLFALIALCSSVLAAPPVARSSDSLIGVGVDVYDITDNLTVKVISERDNGMVKRFQPTILARDGSSGSLIGVGVDVSNILDNATAQEIST